MIDDYQEFLNKRKVAQEQCDLAILCECAVIHAKEFSWDRNVLCEAAFFLGRTDNFDELKELIRPLIREFKSPEKEIRFFDMGVRYPYLEDEELDYLEDLYMGSDTYHMIDRMLFDKFRLRRELAHFDVTQYDIKQSSFTFRFCLEVFAASIKNEREYDIDIALDERRETPEDRSYHGRLFEYEPSFVFSPILVYNRRNNTIEVDTSDLSDRFLFPITCLGSLKTAIDKYVELFGSNIIEETISPALSERWGYSDPKMLLSAQFHTELYMPIENAVCKKYNITPSDNRIKMVRETVARKWLETVNNKPLI